MALDGYVGFQNRQCAGKRAYSDKGDAKRHAKLTQSGSKGGGTLNIYQCPHCTSADGRRVFHVGHPPSNRKYRASRSWQYRQDRAREEGQI